MKDIDRTYLYHNAFMTTKISFTGSIVPGALHICILNARELALCYCSMCSAGDTM